MWEEIVIRIREASGEALFFMVISFLIFFILIALTLYNHSIEIRLSEERQASYQLCIAKTDSASCAIQMGYPLKEGRRSE